MIETSFVGALIDMLHFYGSGTYGQFDRCFRKTCSYFSIGSSGVDLSKLRNTALRFLRCTGYVEVSLFGSEMRWSVAPPTLVQRTAGDFMLIAGFARASEFLSAVPDACIKPHRRIESFRLPGSLRFYPDVPSINIAVQEAEEACRRTGVVLSLDFQNKIFDGIPDSDSAVGAAVESLVDDEQFDPPLAQRFDFAACSWDSFPHTRAVSSGLYRQVHPNAAPRLTIVSTSRGRRLSAYRVVARDWLLIATLALLGKALPVQYDGATGQLRVSRRYHRALRLPTLIERCLRSGSLANPTSNADWIAYDGILRTSFKQLTSKFPIFSAETRR